MMLYNCTHMATVGVKGLIMYKAKTKMLETTYAVNDAGGVKVLDATEHLIEQV